MLHTARTLGRDYDATMDGYAYLLEQLRRDGFRRLRAYVPDSRSKFTTWLVVVARRICLDRIRSRYGRAAQAGPDDREARASRRRLVDLLAEQLDASTLPGPATDDPEMQLRGNELHRALAAVLGDLQPPDRLLLKLRFEDGLPAREIGQVMGFPTPFHVYRRLNALLGQVRVALERRGIQGPGP